MFELRSIEAGYGETTVLRDVSVWVPPGSVVALIGPNGAGKTTLLRLASGLLAPKQGRILLDGEDLTGLTSHEFAARGICHIPEGRGIFRALTVRENLTLQAIDRGHEPEALERAIDAFPVLGERLSQVAGTMSGGQQQMLALARAYVRRPRVVLLDEVSMGLAPKIVEQIFEFIDRLAREGSALLLVEQYVTKALARSQYVYLLNRGRVRFTGEPRELDQERLVADYIGA